MTKKKKIFAWTISAILAVIITLAAAVYQRTTGPTYPKDVAVNINSKEYHFDLSRSNSCNSDCEITVPVNDSEVRGFLVYRHYPTTDTWDTVAFTKSSDGVSAFLPKQPAAGKLEYFLLFRTGNKTFPVLAQTPNVIRFKGDVPGYILAPHIIFMFLGMLLSTFAAFMAGFKLDVSRLLSLITFILILLGGMILGPFVQKFAFDAYWTGVPFGWDLTDNKTLIAFIAWIVALVANRKKLRPGYIIAAAVVTLAIFSIPHSMFGSQLNYTTGNITTG
ncbi:MAG: hypothetical protein WCQ95_07580 [Bacteroidota bacterium]